MGRGESTPIGELRRYTARQGDTSLPVIKNIAKKPLSIRLPGGKKLFLGPGKEGQVGAKAVEHPPVVALIESGELELVSDATTSGSRGDGGGRIGSGQGRNPTTTVFKSGDG